MKIAIVLLLAMFVTAATNVTDPFTKISDMANNLMKSLENFLQNLKESVKTFVSSIAKTLSVILGLLGALLYFSGISKYSGRSMIFSAVLLYILSEVVNVL